MRNVKNSENRSDFLGLILIFLMSFGLGVSLELAQMFDQSGQQEIRQGIHAVFAGLNLLILLFYPNRDHLSRKIPSRFPVSVDRLAIVLCIVGALLNLFLIWVKLKPQFSSAGFTMFWLPISVIVLLILFLATFWVQEVKRPTLVFYLSLGIAVLLGFLRIQGGPPEEFAGQSVERISELLHRFLVGAEPYLIIDTSRSDLFTLLPGLWFILLPGWFLEIDLRWVHLLGALIAVQLVFWGLRGQGERFSGYYLAVFLLTPFMVIGSSLYVGIILLLTASYCVLLHRKYYLFAAAVLGWGLSAFLLLWLSVPFILVYLKRVLKPGVWGLQLLVMFLFAGILIGPFRDSYSMILELPTAGYWEESVFWNSLNIGYFLEELIGKYGLYFLQLVGYIILYSSYIRSSRSLSTCLHFIAVTSYLLSIINRVVEPWYFSYVIFLMIVLSSIPEDERKRPFLNTWESHYR